MDTADQVAYLARIGYTGATEPSPAVLADLQLAHLLTVPFENLSIHTGEEIRLRPDWLFDRVTLRDDRLIVTTGDEKREATVAGADEWRRLAAERFGIDLGGR